MRSEYCERDYDDYEARVEATESRREAIERFSPPVGSAKVVAPDDCYWHELLTAAASLLEEINKRDGFEDDQAKRLAALYREQSAGFCAEMKFPAIKFVRGA